MPSAAALRSSTSRCTTSAPRSFAQSIPACRRARPIPWPRAADVVATEGQHAVTEFPLDLAIPLTLTVAEPEGWADHARVTWQGAPVPATMLDGRPTYALAPGTGDLSVELVDPHATWRLAQYLLAGAVVFLAIPFGSRASRRRP